MTDPTHHPAPAWIFQMKISADMALTTSLKKQDAELQRELKHSLPSQFFPTHEEQKKDSGPHYLSIISAGKRQPT